MISETSTMQRLNNKIVFITGASSGIGKACAEQCAAQGAHLILTARRIDRLKELAQKLTQQHGSKVLPIELDVRDNEAIKRAVSQLHAEWKNIDILINNAGIALTSDKFQEADSKNWDIMI